MYATLSGPNGEEVLVVKGQAVALVDMTSNPQQPLTNVFLLGGGWTTVKGRPNDVAAQLEAENAQ